MAYTYDPALTSQKDQVRLRLSDHITGDMILQDSEIEGLLGLLPYNEACAQLAESISGYYNRKVAEAGNGDMRARWLDRAYEYRMLAEQIRKTDSPAGPKSGGGAVGAMKKPDFSTWRS